MIEITTNKSELASVINEETGSKVLELFTEDKGTHIFMLVNTFEKVSPENPNFFVNGLEVTEIFEENRVLKKREQIKEEIFKIINEKKSKEIEFSSNFHWIFYKK